MVAVSRGGSMSERMRVLKWLALVVVVVLALGLVATGCGSEDEETTTTEAEPSDDGSTEATETTEAAAEEPEQTTLKYAFFAPASTFPAVQMEKWAEEIEKRTDGRVTVETFPGGTLLTPMNMYDGVLQGVADIGLSCPTYEPGRFPLMSINDLPGLYPDGEVASMVTYDVLQEFKPAEFGDYKIVTAFATEPRYFQTADPVSTLDDLSSVTVRTAGGPPYEKMLGAAVESMPMSEVGQALETGVIDGFTSSREVLMDLKFAETVKYWTDYRLGVVSFAALMDKKQYESLPSDIQQIIDDLGPEMAQFAGAYLDEHVQDSLKWAEENEGLQRVELTEEQRASWDEALAPLEDQYVGEVADKGLPAEDFLKRIRELVAEYSG